MLKGTKIIKIHKADTVAVALDTLISGETLFLGHDVIHVQDNIKKGHKIAVQPIKSRENVFKYGYPIGHVTRDIMVGEWVHTHNLKTNLGGFLEYDYRPHSKGKGAGKDCGKTFDGFLREHGQVGIRNEIWIINQWGASIKALKFWLERQIAYLQGEIFMVFMPFLTLMVAPSWGMTTVTPKRY